MTKSYMSHLQQIIVVTLIRNHSPGLGSCVAAVAMEVSAIALPPVYEHVTLLNHCFTSLLISLLVFPCLSRDLYYQI